ncbi:MAG TPA: translation elongation factor Ts, partial [Lentisphaerae bacterium]|nr:translation elongation factor Ts [Lentisphaerota bacterium]
AHEGLVGARISEDGRIGVMVEVNCETDFVARNESFRELVDELLRMVMESGQGWEERARELVVSKIAEIGENIVFRRHVRYALQDTGLIASYIHLGGKIGVLVEVGCNRSETADSEAFRAVVKDITLQIAAGNPPYLRREEVPSEVLEKEKALYAQQAGNKPPHIVEKIVSGKLEKFYSQVCLLEQAYVRDPAVSLQDWLAAQARQLGDNLVVRRFTRFQVGV